MLMGDMSGNQMGKFGQALRRSATKVDDQGDKPIKQGDEDYKILREYATNQLQLATVMYSEPINQQRVRAVLVASQPALSCWSLANSSQRSVADGRDWILSQSVGRFYDFTDEVISVLDSHSAITYIGFEAHKHPTMLAMSDQHIKVILEDELAAMFGRLCTQWLGHRVKRMLHLLRGWPGQCALFGGSREQVADAIALLRSDFSLYSAAQAALDIPPRSDSAHTAIVRDAGSPAVHCALAAQRLGRRRASLDVRAQALGQDLGQSNHRGRSPACEGARVFVELSASVRLALVPVPGQEEGRGGGSQVSVSGAGVGGCLQARLDLVRRGLSDASQPGHELLEGCEGHLVDTCLVLTGRRGGGDPDR